MTALIPLRNFRKGLEVFFFSSSSFAENRRSEGLGAMQYGVGPRDGASEPRERRMARKRKKTMAFLSFDLKSQYNSKRIVFAYKKQKPRKLFGSQESVLLKLTTEMNGLLLPTNLAIQEWHL